MLKAANRRGAPAAGLLAAYRAALYTVRQPDGRRFVLRVGRQSEELSALMRSFSVTAVACITACNPASVRLSDAENRRLGRQLARRVAVSGLAALPTRAKDPHGTWPHEPGLLVMGADQAWCRELGQRLGQNALLYARADAVPRLMML